MFVCLFVVSGCGPTSRTFSDHRCDRALHLYNSNEKAVPVSTQTSDAVPLCLQFLGLLFLSCSAGLNSESRSCFRVGPLAER